MEVKLSRNKNLQFATWKSSKKRTFTFLPHLVHPLLAVPFLITFSFAKA